jgi:hypothetical protein
MSAGFAQPDLELMPKLERAVARNLQDYVAAYRHLAPQVGAAGIEVAGGVAAFTGIDSPLTTVKGTGPGFRCGISMRSSRSSVTTRGSCD